MRTTVVLRDGLDQRLRERARRLGISYKEALNQVVEAGLTVSESAPPPYAPAVRALGTRPGFDWDHLNRLASELEDESF